MDVKNMGGTRVMVVTDKTVGKLDAMKQVQEGLGKEGVEFRVYDGVRVEPKDSSVKEAIDFAKPWRPDFFIAVGGGSVIDTAKLMNLYTSFPGTLRWPIFDMRRTNCSLQRMTSSTSSTHRSEKASQ